MRYRQEFLTPEKYDLTALLQQIQSISGVHAAALGQSWEVLDKKGLFWAIIRHKLEIYRLPEPGEQVVLETWPMPTTRTCYPRATAGYDLAGRPLFRSTALWVLMDKNTRAMVLPGKSDVIVEGALTGEELDAPGSLPPLAQHSSRSVRVGAEQLDENGHMNNTRYLDFLQPLFPAGKTPRTITLCYLAEALKDQELTLCWRADEAAALTAEILRWRTDVAGKYDRIFAAKVEF